MVLRGVGHGTQIFFIPTPSQDVRFPGINEMENWARGNKFEAAKKRKLWKGHIVRHLGMIRKYKRVFIQFEYVEKDKRRDPDNIAGIKKIILDALVYFGAIKNDGWKQVAGWADEFTVSKNEPGIFISINEVE